MKKFAVGAAALLLLSATVMPPAVKASANSAPAYWEGSPAQGVFTADPACPVRVLHETLTIRLEELPEMSYPSAEAFAEYRSSVTAAYTFYNPTASDLTARLFFPFGRRPDFARDEGAEGYFDDAARYDVRVGEDAVPRRIRYTYSSGFSDFDLSDISRLHDDKKRDGIWTEEAICRTHVFDVGAENEETLVKLTLSYNPARTAILARSASSWGVENGDLTLYLSSEDPSFISFGNPPEVRSAEAVKEEVVWEVAAGIPLSFRTEDAPFGEFAEALRPAQVEEVDWFHALADCMEDRASRYGVIVSGELSEGELARWYDYTLGFPAGETVSNAVTAPFYPDYITSSRYRYAYLLSPARLWADFGELEINVLTDFEIEDFSLQMEKTENGYYGKRQGLPLEEFTFSVYGGGIQEEAPPLLLYFVYFLLGVYVLRLPAALIALPVAFAVRAVGRRKARRKK